ncbi:MAG TPA: hypothetical protein PKG95_05465 [Anaerolineaceae bacterium]|jgi:hypothetical protein|nr:hypothetical protein [Anaerolineaceae bacterium]
MKKTNLLIILLLLAVLLAACSSKDPQKHDDAVEKKAVLDLICGTVPQAACQSRICPDAATCPVVIALSEPAVFDFIATYSACPDCSTPDFAPEDGIGRCVEYATTESPSGWEVTFWVSENCSFRHARPTESRVVVQINHQTLDIKKIRPATQIISDPLYCQNKGDCVSLSGSGLPFTGCSNSLYGPLNWTGYYSGTECTCHKHQCVIATPKE